MPKSFNFQNSKKPAPAKGGKGSPEKGMLKDNNPFVKGAKKK